MIRLKLLESFKYCAPRNYEAFEGPDFGDQTRTDDSEFGLTRNTRPAILNRHVRICARVAGRGECRTLIEVSRANALGIQTGTALNEAGLVLQKCTKLKQLWRQTPQESLPANAARFSQWWPIEGQEPMKRDHQNESGS